MATLPVGTSNSDFLIASGELCRTAVCVADDIDDDRDDDDDDVDDVDDDDDDDDDDVYDNTYVPHHDTYSDCRLPYRRSSGP